MARDLVTTLQLKDKFSASIIRISNQTQKFMSAVDKASKAVRDMQRKQVEIKMRLKAERIDAEIKRIKEDIAAGKGLKDIFSPSILRWQAHLEMFRRKAISATAQVKVALEKLKPVTDFIAGTFNKLKNSVFSLPGLIAAAGIGGLIDKSLETSAKFETNTIAMETFLKSKQQAKEMMSDLVAFSATTNFQLTDWTDRTSQLLAGGFKKNEIVPLLKDMGNAAVGTGKGAQGLESLSRAFGELKRSPRLTEGIADQFMDAGVNVRQYLIDAGKAKNMQIAALKIEHQTIKAEEAMKLIRSGMRRTFMDEKGVGMMERMMATLDGTMSNLKDFMTNNILKQFGDAISDGILPYLKKFSDGLSGNKKLIDFLQKSLGSIGKSIGEFAGKGIDVFYNFINELINNENFKSMGFFDKFIFIIKCALEKLKTYMEGEGGDKTREIVKNMVEIIISVLKDSVTILMPLMVQIGAMLGAGIVMGIGQAINEMAFGKEKKGYISPLEIERLNAVAAEQPHIVGSYDFYKRFNPPKAHAAGLASVPYDNYPAILHKGERVLTASENRQQKGTSTINIGSINISKEVDADNFLKRMAQLLEEGSNNFRKGALAW